MKTVTMRTRMTHFRLGVPWKAAEAVKKNEETEKRFSGNSRLSQAFNRIVGRSAFSVIESEAKKTNDKLDKIHDAIKKAGGVGKPQPVRFA